MGFYWMKKAADEDQKVLSNTEMTLAIKESTEKMITSMFGDILALNGASLEEIPEEYVSMYNKYVRQYNEMFGICLKWAAYQDERDEKTDKMLQKIYKEQQEFVQYVKNEYNKAKKGGDRS